MDAAWIWCCHGCGVGLSCSSSVTLEQELPYATGVGIKRKRSILNSGVEGILKPEPKVLCPTQNPQKTSHITQSKVASLHGQKDPTLCNSPHPLPISLTSPCDPLCLELHPQQLPVFQNPLGKTRVLLALSAWTPFPQLPTPTTYHGSLSHFPQFFTPCCLIVMPSSSSLKKRFPLPAIGQAFAISFNSCYFSSIEHLLLGLSCPIWYLMLLSFSLE